jgi:non-heme chloroperoxidase
MSRLVLGALLPTTALAVAAAAAIAFGGPGEPAPMPSINDPFRNVDYSALPAASTFSARDGARLAYRAYAAEGATQGSVLLVHGSSARGSSMHVLARAFAAAGYAVYALDIRGHGESGTKGQIDYIGQLDDDVEDFVRSVQPARPATLAGFSSGGGFSLRIAAGERQKLFDNYLLLSPFISQDAPTYRPDSGGWVQVGLPRYVAIGLLHTLGIRAFDDLPVTRFALNDAARAMLTPQYSFALAQNFRPRADWRASIRAAGQPMRLLAGSDDEAFHAQRFAEVFKAEGKEVPVTLLPGLGHIALTLDPAAVRAAVAAVQDMNASPAPLAQR